MTVGGQLFQPKALNTLNPIPKPDSNKALNENLETEYQMTFRCDKSKTFNP